MKRLFRKETINLGVRDDLSSFKLFLILRPYSNLLKTASHYQKQTLGLIQSKNEKLRLKVCKSRQYTTKLQYSFRKCSRNIAILFNN